MTLLENTPYTSCADGESLNEPDHWPVTSPTRFAVNPLMLTPQVRVPKSVALAPEIEAVAAMVSAPLPALNVRLAPLKVPVSMVNPQMGFAASPVIVVPLCARNKPFPEPETTQFPATDAETGTGFEVVG